MPVRPEGLLLGPHYTGIRGHAETVEVTAHLGGNTYQFYIRSPFSGKLFRSDGDDVQRAARLREQRGIAPPFAHSLRDLNLAAEGPLWEGQARRLVEDLGCARDCGCAALVVHPGVAGGARQEAVHRAGRALAQALQMVSGEVGILLESRSAPGELGTSPEELAAIIRAAEDDPRLGVCIDTGHLYAAGLLLPERSGRLRDKLERAIGLERVRLCHLNDIVCPAGGGPGSHVRFGMGDIALTGFLDIFRGRLLDGLPLVVETPARQATELGIEMDNIRRLIAVAGQG